MDVILEELSEITSDNPGPEDAVLEEDLTKAINDFLKGLPVDKRVMFVRRYWYSDDISSIAQRMRMNENSVVVSIRRIRIKLRDYLAERGFDL